MQIIELRERHGLTQSELAERCGMDQGDITRIERGSTSPTERTLQRIAGVMGGGGPAGRGVPMMPDELQGED